MKVNIFGKKSLYDAIENNSKIISINTSIDSNEFDFFKKKKIFNIVPKKYFEKYRDINHQWYHSIIEINVNKFDLKSLIQKNANIDRKILLVLDEIQDPGNFGAILRSALAFGVNGIIYKKNNQVSLENNVVIKKSMGAIHKLNFCEVVNLNRTIKTLKEAGYWIYCTNLSDKANEINEVSFDNSTVLIIGNENNGVSKSLISNSDFEIKIKINPEIQSLNVSVACGILLNKFYNF